MRRGQQRLLVFLAALTLLPSAALAQERGMKGMEMPMKAGDKMPPASDLKPAEGAKVKIVAPKKGQIFKGNQVPLEFKLVKGKVGRHVHAYVDGQLMGMFESEKGTLTGIQPGNHTLEVRVATEDHKTELKATDKVQFVVKK
jgi:hypothetical protein